MSWIHFRQSLGGASLGQICANKSPFRKLHNWGVIQKLHSKMAVHGSVQLSYHYCILSYSTARKAHHLYVFKSLQSTLLHLLYVFDLFRINNQRPTSSPCQKEDSQPDQLSSFSFSGSGSTLRFRLLCKSNRPTALKERIEPTIISENPNEEGFPLEALNRLGSYVGVLVGCSRYT